MAKNKGGVFVSHWSTITESGTVLGMRFLLVVYQVFGRAIFRVFLLPVMLYFYLLRHEARHASQFYLDRIQPFLKDDGVKLSSLRHFLTFGEVLLDKFLAWMGKIALADVIYLSDGHFERALEKKKGGVIIVSHLGNIEVCHAIAHQQPNLKLNLLVYTQHAKKFNALMKKFNHRQIEMIQVTEMTPAFAIVMAERVAAGEYVAIAGDRTPITGEQRTSITHFFGHQAALPQGAYILAGLLKCPVYLMFCLKSKQQYTIYMEQFAEQLTFPRKERAQYLQQYAQAYANRLQHYCLKAPLQWFNFYHFWLDTKKES
jgi:predicted LPLAT superfamily acyltransferase